MVGGRWGEGRTLRKRLGTPTSRIWFVSPVIVRLINWAATYDEVFIVLVMAVAKAISLFSKKKEKKKRKEKKKILSSRISYQTTLLLDKPKTVSVNGMCSSF